MKKNAVLYTFSQDLERQGLTAPKVSQRGSGHWLLSWADAPGRDLNMIVPATPSDQRAGLNAKSFARRLMRESEQVPSSRDVMEPSISIEAERTAEERTRQTPKPPRAKHYNDTSFVRGRGQAAPRGRKQRTKRNKEPPARINPAEMALFEMQIAIDGMMEEIQRLPESEHVPMDLFSVADRDVAETLNWRK